MIDEDLERLIALIVEDSHRNGCVCVPDVCVTQAADSPMLIEVLHDSTCPRAPRNRN